MECLIVQLWGSFLFVCLYFCWNDGSGLPRFIPTWILFIMLLSLHSSFLFYVYIVHTPLWIISRFKLLWKFSNYKRKEADSTVNPLDLLASFKDSQLMADFVFLVSTSVHSPSHSNSSDLEANCEQLLILTSKTWWHFPSVLS